MNKASMRTLIIYILAVVILGITLFPILWVVLSSLKPEGEILSTHITFIPQRITLANYKELFTHFQFQKYLMNSVIIAVTTTILSVIFGVLAAYGFSRFSFPLSSKILFLIILVKVFTPAALVVPLYDLMSWLNLTDTLIAIIVGVTVMNLPFVIYMMKTFFDNFPKELEEAAMVDGMTPLCTLVSIVIPISMSSIVTVALFCFSAGWSDFLFSLSFSQTIKSMPATVAIANMDTGYKVYWGAMMSGGTFLSVPILIIAFAFQKYFVRGISAGALKQ